MGIMSIKNTGYIPFGPYGHDPVFDRFQFEVDKPEGKGQNAILDNVGPIQKKMTFFVRFSSQEGYVTL